MASACSSNVIIVPLLSCVVYTFGAKGVLSILTPNHLSRRSSSSCTLLARYVSLSFLASFLICLRRVAICSCVVSVALFVFCCCNSVVLSVCRCCIRAHVAVEM